MTVTLALHWLKSLVLGGGLRLQCSKPSQSFLKSVNSIFLADPTSVYHLTLQSFTLSNLFYQDPLQASKSRECPWQSSVYVLAQCRDSRFNPPIRELRSHMPLQSSQKTKKDKNKKSPQIMKPPAKFPFSPTASAPSFCSRWHSATVS